MTVWCVRLATIAFLALLLPKSAPSGSTVLLAQITMRIILVLMGLILWLLAPLHSMIANLHIALRVTHALEGSLMTAVLASIAKMG